MTDNEAKAAVKLLLASYPTQRQRMTPDDIAMMTKAYATAFIAFDDGELQGAISALVLTARWLPTIAEIVAKVAEMKHGRRRDGLIAWGDVTHAMSRYGSYRTPGVDFHFDDPIVARLVRALRWSDLCAAEGPAQAADRARFVDAYNNAAASAASDVAVAGALPGLEAKELPGGVRDLVQGLVAAKALKS